MSSKKQLNDKDLELISASLDQELSEFERRRLNNSILLNESGDDTGDEAHKKLQRYSLLSSIMKKECDAAIDVNFSSRVMQSIHERANNEFEPSELNDSELYAGYNSQSNKKSNSIKQIAGLAIAVSVATVSFLSFQQFAQTNLNTDQYSASVNQTESWDTKSLNSQTINAAEVANKIFPSVQFVPVQLNAKPIIGNAGETQPHTPDQDIEAYIYNHSGYASGRIVSPYSEITRLKDSSD
jgi:negative regulator of sigma E activity